MAKLQNSGKLNITKLQGYDSFLRELKERVRSAQIEAAVSLNAELIGLYWHIGKSIVEQQKKSGWGDAILKRLSKDLASAFPDMKGFSERNLYRMRTFYLAYRADSDICATSCGTNSLGA